MDIKTIGIKVDTSSVSVAVSTLNSLTQSSKRVEGAINEVGKASGALPLPMRKVTESTKQTNQAFKDLDSTSNQVLKSLKSLAVVGGMGFGVRELIQVGDQWTNLNNRLKLVTSSTQEAKAAQQAVVDIAMATRQPLQASAELYQRIAKNQKELNLSSRQIADVTKTIAQTMVISGVSAQAAEAALVQLGQAMASGTLRGDELNSILEQAPALASAIADGMGVTVGALRSLGAEGKITAEAVITAIQKQAKAVDQDFNKMGATVGQALTNMRTQFEVFVGNLDEGLGVTARLAESINWLAQNFTTFASILVSVSAGMLTYKAAVLLASSSVGALVKVTWAAVTAKNGLALASLKLNASLGIAAIGSYVKGLWASVVATGGLASATKALALAMAKLAFTPMGLAIGAAATAFYLLTGNQDKNKDSLDALSMSVDEYTEKLKEKTRAQIEDEKATLNSLLADKEKSLAVSFNVGVNGIAEVRALEEINKIFKDTSLSAVEVEGKVSAYLNSISGGTRISDRFIDNVRSQLGTMTTSRQEYDNVADRLKVVQSHLDGTAKNTDKLTSAQQNNAKSSADAAKEYDKIIQKLKEQVQQYGLTASEMERQKALALGLGEEQAALAEALTKQKTVLDEIKEAAETGNDVALKSARAEYQANQEKIRQLEFIIQLQGKQAEMAKLASDKSVEGVMKFIQAQNELIKMTADYANYTAPVPQNLPATSTDLRFKGSQATAGGSSHAGTYAAGHAIQSMFGDNLKHFAAFNDGWHQANRPNSKHTTGLALDATIIGGSSASAEQVKKYFKDLGFEAGKDFFVQFEKAGEKGATGDHLHFQWNSTEAAQRFAGLSPDKKAEVEGARKAEEELAKYREDNVRKDSDLKLSLMQERANRVKGNAAADFAMRRANENAIHIEKLANLDAQIAIEKARGTNEGRQKALDLEREKTLEIEKHRTAIMALADQEKQANDARVQSMREATEAAKLYIETLKQADERALEGYGKGNRRRAVDGRKNEASDRLYDEVREASARRGNGEIDENAYQELVNQAKWAYEQALEQAEWFYDEETKKRSDWSLGAKEALINYADEALNAYESVGSAVGNAFKGMEDALVSFVTTGKADFKSLADSIIKDLARIAIQQSITGPLSNALGGLFGGGHSFGGAGTVASVGHGFTMSGFSGGGYTGAGGKYEPAGIVHKGEGVLTQEEVAALGGASGFESFRKVLREKRGYANGGYVGAVSGVPAVNKSSGVQVNILNQSSQQVSGNAKISADEMGRTVIDVMLYDLNSNGRYIQSLKHAMG